MRTFENAHMLKAIAPTARLVSSSEQANLVSSFRSQLGSGQRNELTFADIADALTFIERQGNLEREVFWLGYSVERDPCVQVKLEQALQALRVCNTMLSLDGFVILNYDFSAGTIADYEEVVDSRSSGEVYLSQLSRALNG